MKEVIKKRQQQTTIEISDEESTTPLTKKYQLHDSEDEIVLPTENMLSNEDEANSLEEIRDTISSVFIDEYDGKIPFNILIIFDINIDRFLNNDDDEEDDYE